MDKLVWNVYVHDRHKHNISVYNIFDNLNIIGRLKNIYKLNNKEEFLEELDKCLLYFFWAKYEWEITIFNWTPSDNFEYRKVDVYSQIKTNWKPFSEYVWNNKHLIKELEML